MVVRVLAVLLLVPLLAGCTSDVGSDGPAPSPSPSASPTEDGTPDDAPDPPDAPWTTHWYLDEGGLVAEDPGAGSIPLDCGWRSFAGGCDLADGEYFTPTFDPPVHVAPQRVIVDLWLETDAVALGNPVFDVAAWFGSTRGSTSFTFTSVVTMTAGDATQVSLDMGFEDHPGIVLPAGESLMVRILTALEPEGAGLHRILTGGDTPSGVTLTVQNLTEEPMGPVNATEEFTGTLQGGAFVECAPGPESHAFQVPEDASFIDLRLVATGPSPTIDADLDLFDGGTLVAHAGSPYAEEEILLAGPALEPYLGKELQAGATLCVGGQADYTIDVEIGGAVPA